MRLLEAADGRDGGLALLEAETRPDLVLLDVRLPDMSGLEVCWRIKTDHPGVVVLQTSAAFVRSSRSGFGAFRRGEFLSHRADRG